MARGAIDEHFVECDSLHGDCETAFRAFTIDTLFHLSLCSGGAKHAYDKCNNAILNYNTKEAWKLFLYNCGCKTVALEAMRPLKLGVPSERG